MFKLQYIVGVLLLIWMNEGKRIIHCIYNGFWLDKAMDWEEKGGSSREFTAYESLGTIEKSEKLER